MTKAPQKPSPRSDATLSIRTSKAVRDGVEAFAASEKMKRSRATSLILEDWLRTHGWLTGGDHLEPTGPATDAVAAMDQAIKGDRTRGKNGHGAAPSKRLGSNRKPAKA